MIPDNVFLLMSVIAFDVIMIFGIMSSLSFYRDIKNRMFMRVINTILIFLITALFCCSIALTATLVHKIFFVD